ncbi:DNA/RNA helicase [Cohnella fermenti]|uniref:DNA/RNA helicase n=1 Tax=Cohnella fermenti TaxID=2565925 RepID=A0A4V3WDM6_9BACL|nr:DNA/RNA helicase [Cohnella fermenti]THF72666.1 DNA/RNA helicase [Cohnella fermenti]
MSGHAALLFRFPQARAAEIAFDTLEELGYSPQMNGEAVLHIHVEREDLTSALEVVQAHGGELIEQAESDIASAASAMYGMDGIPIPAHTVNEDWPDSYMDADLANRNEDSEDSRFPTDDGSYDRFDAR